MYKIDNKGKFPDLDSLKVFLCWPAVRKVFNSLDPIIVFHCLRAKHFYSGIAFFYTKVYKTIHKYLELFFLPWSLCNEEDEIFTPGAVPQPPTPGLLGSATSVGPWRRGDYYWLVHNEGTSWKVTSSAACPDHHLSNSRLFQVFSNT